MTGRFYWVEDAIMRSGTEGVSTPSILPPSRLWRPTQTRIPDAAMIEEAIESVGRAEVTLPAAGLGGTHIYNRA